MKILNNDRGIQIRKELFCNTPNLTLRGSTFDVNHLYRFITQGGESNTQVNFYPNNSRTQTDMNSVKSMKTSNVLASRIRFNRGASNNRNKGKENTKNEINIVASKNLGSGLMTNVRPSSTFLSVPRYTSSYLNTEK